MDKRTMGMWFKSALISGVFCMSGVLTGCGSDEPAGDVILLMEPMILPRK